MTRPAGLWGELQKKLDRDAVAIDNVISYAGTHIDASTPACWLGPDPDGTPTPGVHESVCEARGGSVVPAARAAVAGSGVLIVVGGLMVLLGVSADLGALLLVVFLVPTAFLMHGPWKADDDQEKQMEQIQFLKDLSLAGAALILFALLSALPDLGMMITGPVFDGLWS